MTDPEVRTGATPYANPWWSVRSDTLHWPDGSTSGFDVVVCGAIAVTIALEDGRVHLVDQYRPAVRRRTWEFPSGGTEDGELDPATVAARELAEETGLRAGTLERLGTIDVAPGMSDLACHVFLATDLTPGEPNRDPGTEQGMTSAWFGLDEVASMIDAGTLCDGKSLAALALLQRRLG